MNRKILVLGANGMLGGSIFRYLSNRSEFDVVGSVRSEHAKLSLAQQGFSNVVTGTDVTDKDAIDHLIRDLNPDVVLNCIGVIKQLDASKMPVVSIELNSLLPHRLAVLCEKYSSFLVHFSTDCIFSGNRGMYSEDDIPDAGDLYGKSKLLGEVDYHPHLTLRTSIIGHELFGHVSLVDWFLSQKYNVKGFSNATFSGLPTVFVAEFLVRFVLQGGVSGLYNLSVEPIDKFELLKLIRDIYKVDIEIEECPNFKIDRSLNSNKLRATTGFVPPSWPELIEKMHSEYREYFEKM